MQIFGRLYPILVVCSVLGFQKRFLRSLLGGLILMDCVTFLKHLTPGYELGCGIFLFGSFKEVSEILGLFLLFAFGLKSLYSAWFSRGLIRLLCDLREKSGELKHGFCSEKVLDAKCGLLKFLEEDSDVPLNDKVEESREKLSSYPESDGKINTESDEQFDADNNDDDDEYTEEDGESDAENNVDDDRSYTEEDGDSDVSALRRLIKIERRRGNAACTELEKERAASATAAEEAMAMILRLQNEKSLIEMEFIQYRRLAEEKQIHDQEVIQSLQWIVWRHESERSLLQEELKFCRRKLNRLLKSDEREVEESPNPLSGYAEDVLENLLYSSLDFNLTPK